MFSSALKSFSSNINSNYTSSPDPAFTTGPWRIHDAKKKSSGKDVSLFVFDRKTLDARANGLEKATTSNHKRVVEEVVERLRKEASSLARLRHPNILELVEPVEETRNGGLQFVTEAVLASLSGVLEEKDEQERAGGISGRSSRHVLGDADGGFRRRDVELDELEVRKGLLQLGGALQFLHQNASLVHSNLTPDAIFLNAKSDWKLSGLSFLSPPDTEQKVTSITPISLSEVTKFDPRLPRSVQLNLDYASPDFVQNNSINTSADMFALGLLIIALYSSPHTSPLKAHSSIATYKRLFSMPSTFPTSTNGFLSSRALPKELATTVLPRLLTLNSAQRLTALEFQKSAYFDHILVSTIRFLESLPGKTSAEKAQFMRGVLTVIPRFPKSVLEKKVLPSLLEEMKDRELLALILRNIFCIIELLVSGRKAFTERVLPCIEETFAVATNKKHVPTERDQDREAALTVLLDNMTIITKNCSQKEFHDKLLPIFQYAMESPTHSVVDLALRTLRFVLPVVDFSTVKSEVFPVISSVFTKTSSLGIKVRSLEAFVVLCGGSAEHDDDDNDGFNGTVSSDGRKTPTTVLDKYTIQEKIVPLVRAIKTREPAVMLAVLKVLRQVGTMADIEFIAIEILPILWTMGLGPLLNTQQFQAFMDLVKSLSSKVEMEQSRKLRELAQAGTAMRPGADDIMSFGNLDGSNLANAKNVEEDFKRLVYDGGTPGTTISEQGSAWGTDSDATTLQPQYIANAVGVPAATPPVIFNWSTPQSSTIADPIRNLMPSTATPDLSLYESLTPAKVSDSQAAVDSRQKLSNALPRSAAFPAPPSSQISGPSPNWLSGASNMPNKLWPSTGAQNYSREASAYGDSQFTGSVQARGQTEVKPILTSSHSFSLPPPPSMRDNHISQDEHMYKAVIPERLRDPQTQGNISPRNLYPNSMSGQPGLDAFESLL